MLETRLRKRVRTLGMASLAAYCKYVDTPQGREEEWPNFIDAITTHKTDFFREPAHFEYLIESSVPELDRLFGAGTRRPLLLWSSACSTGEKPYTLAMVLSAFAPPRQEATISGSGHRTSRSRSLKRPRRAVYPETAVRTLPDALRRPYFLRSRNQEQKLVRVVPEIRARVEFRQLNLMDAEYGFREPFDVVLCRNVMIYFDRATQQKVLNSNRADPAARRISVHGAFRIAEWSPPSSCPRSPPLSTGGPMSDAAVPPPMVFLHPGELFTTDEPAG